MPPRKREKNPGKTQDAFQLSVGQNMEAFRKARNMSRKNVADAIGTTETTVYRWERGYSPPDLHDVSSYSSVVDVEPTNFFQASVTDVNSAIDLLNNTTNKTNTEE